MKKLIVALFAVAGLCLGNYAQDLSFKSFDKTLVPEGNLVMVEKWDDQEHHYYQAWTEQGVVQWWFYYDPRSKIVEEATSRQVFFDELDFDDITVTPASSGKYVTVRIKTKDEQSVALYMTYRKDEYVKTTFRFIDLLAKNQNDADALVKKLKEKAFDMALELDAKIDRVSPLSESLYYSEGVPNGGTFEESQAVKNGTVAPSGSKDTDDDVEKPTTSKNTASSNSSVPKEKTEITLRLWNKSEGEIDIAYESRGAGGSRTETTISGRSTKSVKMKVGGRVFGANGAVLLTVTAAMDDTEQVIFR